MLNYINKSMYLPKIAPLKWGRRGVRGVWVCGGIMEIVKVIWKAPHMGQYLPIEVPHVPNLLHGKLNLNYLNCLHNTPQCIPNTQTSLTPYSPISVAPSLVSTHFYLCSLTFSLRPDEAASVWRLESLSVIN